MGEQLTLDLDDAAAAAADTTEFTPSREEQESTMQFPYGQGSIFDPGREDKLTTIHERLALDINLYSNWQSGWSHRHSHETRAKRTGYSRRAVKRALDELVEMGWLEKKPGPGNLPNTYRLIHHKTDDVPRDKDGKPLKVALPIGEGTPLDPNKAVDGRTTVAWYKTRMCSEWTTGIINLSLAKMREITGYAISTCSKIRKEWRKLGNRRTVNVSVQTAVYQLWPKPYKERRKRKEESHKGMPKDESFYYSYNRQWKIHHSTAQIWRREPDGWRHANEHELEQSHFKIFRDFMEVRDIIWSLNSLKNSLA